jgi:DNA-directed RNA polymerase subunit L
MNNLKHEIVKHKETGERIDLNGEDDTLRNLSKNSKLISYHGIDMIYQPLFS